MCTLALWWRAFDGFPVVVAANRDEDVARPSEPPHLWPQGFYAGRDARAGGAWLGVNARGVFCGITNRWDRAPDPSRKSRGAIVVDALASATANEAVERLASLPPGAYNAFGLLIADAASAFRVDYADQAIVQPLGPGITVLANWPAGEKWPRTERALALAAAVPTDSFDRALPSLESLLADHEGAGSPGRAICVHDPHHATVSSTILAIGNSQVRWRESTGNPCQGHFIEHAVRFD